MMVLSWAMVEVIRYSFYLSALLMKVIPYPIFLRAVFRVRDPLPDGHRRRARH